MVDIKVKSRIDKEEGREGEEFSPTILYENND